MTTKRKNPADTTLRNLRAERKRNATLLASVFKLNARVKKLEHYVGVLLRARRKTFYVSGDN